MTSNSAESVGVLIGQVYVLCQDSLNLDKLVVFLG